jgi:Na+-driven multidrug efflux pump
VLGGVVNVALNFAWIPRFGAVGAAWATLVSYAAAGVGSTALYPRAWPLLRVQVAALLVFARPLSVWRRKLSSEVGVE